MDAREILRIKRDGGELSREAIQAFFDGYLARRISDESAAALLTAVFIHGMSERELFSWTEAMLRSGESFTWEGLNGPVVDKHSTGGIGDKVSIPLAPALAACGVHVPMISGRGLGHTGGTLDKLESIPGFATDLSPALLREQVRRLGCAFGAQTEAIVPADMRLYALRDRVGLVASVPLIASSILSKKLAEGLDALVLDVKYGSGAFLADVARGEELIRTLLALADGFGLRTSVFHTSMNQPLGRTVGHALEIEESVACLSGRGPADLVQLVTTFGGELLAQAGCADDARRGARRIAGALEDGSAREVFVRVIEDQGGDPRVVDDPARLPRAPESEHLIAERNGYLDFVDVRKIGLAVLALGGGRAQAGDVIDPAVGLRWRAKFAAPIHAGDELVEILHRDGRGLERARALLGDSLRITDELAVAPPLIRPGTNAVEPVPAKGSTGSR